MNLLLTSCGLETQAITDVFLRLLPKAPTDTRALFIPTAARDPDAIEVLPKCLHDLLRIGVPRENITVHDLHDPIEEPLLAQWDAIYLCGGDTRYLLRRVNEQGFRNQLLRFIKEGGMVLGVSAGSLLFAENLPDHLGLLPCSLDVHCPDDACDRPGPIDLHQCRRIRLGNRQAILWQNGAPHIVE